MALSYIAFNKKNSIKSIVALNSTPRTPSYDYGLKKKQKQKTITQKSTQEYYGTTMFLDIAPW